MDNIPQHFQLVYHSEEVGRRILELGSAITEYAFRVWKDSHTDLLAIPVLRGGMFFFSHLVQAIEHSVEIAPVRAWGYDGNSIAKEMRVSMEDVPAGGRAVLIVDDICDSGRTLEAMKSAFLRAGAREVRSAVLIKRVIGGVASEPDWVGFSYQGSEWLVGWGMDDSERFRNMRDIYAVCKPTRMRA